MRPKLGQHLHGLLLVDKPKGVTSHDVVQKVRRICGTIPSMPKSNPEIDRRQHVRKENRAEMYLGSSASAVSNLSINGAYVSILSGLHAEDSFSFELVLDGREQAPVRGRAVVVWIDPGIGAGVSFQLSAAETERLANYIEELAGDATLTLASPDPTESEDYETPRRSRRTVAVGPDKDGGSSRVWFRYFPPEKTL